MMINKSLLEDSITARFIETRHYTLENNDKRTLRGYEAEMCCWQKDKGKTKPMVNTYDYILQMNRDTKQQACH